MLIIVLQSIERLANPQPIFHEELGIIVSTIAMVFTTALVIFQTIVAKKSGSLIIASDRLHYAGDIAFNLGVLIALFLSATLGISWADPAMAILIAVVILWSTRSIGLRAFNNLMDRELPDSEKARIEQVIATLPEIRGVHKLKTRASGNKPFIQMHIELDAQLSFREAHAIADRLERALMENFPGSDIIVHPDLYEHHHSDH